MTKVAPFEVGPQYKESSANVPTRQALRIWNNWTGHVVHRHDVTWLFLANDMPA